MTLADRFHRFWTGLVIVWSLSMAAAHHFRRARRRRQWRREVRGWGW